MNAGKANCKGNNMMVRSYFAGSSSSVSALTDDDACSSEKEMLKSNSNVLHRDCKTKHDFGRMRIEEASSSCTCPFLSIVKAGSNCRLLQSVLDICKLCAIEELLLALDKEHRKNK